MGENRHRSVIELFHHRVQRSADLPAMYGKRGDDWPSISWREAGKRVRRIACGLHSLDLPRGGRAAILATSTPEWVLADLGILAAAGATTTLYPSNTPAECAYILSDSEAVLCFVENETQAEKLRTVRDQIPAVSRVIVLDLAGRASDDGWVMTLHELERLGESWDGENPGAYEEVSGGVGPDDLATIIYTSGTTGKPKGVMLTHDNWVYIGEALEEMGILIDPSTQEGEGDVQYLFLPLAHSFAKALELAFIQTGVPTAIHGVVDDVVPGMGAIRPTVAAAVPRVFEKVYGKVVQGAEEAGGLKLKIFRWALGVGREVSALRQRGEDAAGLLALKHKIADKLVFSKLKARFGGRMRFFISGGAPLSREIAEFFHAADILVLEGYGLTETSAASFLNRPESFRFGTVGHPVPGTKVKIAEDGEILIHGRGVMRGYYNRPEESAEVLEADGWFHTGDIGRLDDDGFLSITDRKKDIIVTAGGKNIAPQVIENMLKASSSWISQVVMLGDRRPYCVALVTIDEETVGAWATGKGLSFKTYADLAALPAVRDLVWADVEAVNARLASYETIKKVHLLDRDFSQEAGELTPKMSIKRRVVEDRNREALEALYAE